MPTTTRGNFHFNFCHHGGTTELIYSNHIFPYFQKVSHGLYPNAIVCPFDVARHAAADLQTLNDSNISYFLNADAVEIHQPIRFCLATDFCKATASL